jgi:ribosomal protein L29
MSKNYNSTSAQELYHCANEYNDLIKIHKNYLKTAFNTFLGPLGAKAEIKRCKKEISKINKILNEKDWFNN